VKHVREVSSERFGVQEPQAQVDLPALALSVPTYKSDFRLAVGAAFSNFFDQKRSEVSG